MNAQRPLWNSLLGMAVAGLAMLGLSGSAAANPCVIPEGPPGTVTLPPAGCDYLSPDEVHVIVDGLPPGTTIELAPIHRDFICDRFPGCTTLLPPGECEAPGGGLGGNGDCFESTLELQATGTGALAGFNRLLVLSTTTTEVHTGPRNPGDPVQDFDTEMVQLQASLVGDPDFAQLTIQAGSGFGLPSPGHTTLTDLGNGTFNVDSFFDVFYEIDFVGAPGGALAGMAGTTQANLTMRAGVPALPNPCFVPDNGSGTVTLPPEGCEYLSPDEVHMILNDMPPGTTIELAAIHKDFICGGQGLPQPVCSIVLGSGVCEGAGGSLGGNADCFDSVAELDISGTGALTGFNRTVFVPLGVEVHSGPRTPGSAVQDFDTEMVQLDGAIPPGDPDFDILTIRAGSNFGLPSPGHTTLTRLGPPGSDFQVDSFFDVFYEIDFQGQPGSALEGLNGTTQGTIRMQTGDPQQPDPSIPAAGVREVVVLAVLLVITLGFVMRRRASI